jgi:hypothetical protein
MLSAALLLSTTLYARSAEVDDDLFIAFETLCLRTADAKIDVPEAMKDIGFPPIEAGLAKQILAPQSGRAWAGSRTRFPLVVVLTDDGVCGVTSTDADGGSVRLVIEQQPSAKKLQSERRLRCERLFLYGVFRTSVWKKPHVPCEFKILDFELFEGGAAYGCFPAVAR